MLISCITVTQAGRLPLLRNAIADYARQTYASRELVIIHTGDSAFDVAVRALCASGLGTQVYVHAAAQGTTLGALRNLAIDLARGELVCQWDDDDRYHPMRLELQAEALVVEGADFCFLSDQLHWFSAHGTLTWDDWDREPYPLNFVQGTLLGRRAVIPRYPELARGEDTALCLSILQAGNRITRLRDVGWCYVYVYHGTNVWPQGHHAAIAQAKNFGAARLLGKEKILRERLAEYEPPLGTVLLPYPGGQIKIENKREMNFRPHSWDQCIFESVLSGEYGEIEFHGKTVIDIGAHIGSFTMLASRKGARRILAFEAWEENYSLLVKNCQQLVGVECHHALVWRSDNHRGALRWRKCVNTQNTGGGTVIECASKAGELLPDGDAFEVQQISLDEIVGQLGEVDLLKIDAEGSEYPILFTSKRLDRVKEIVGEYHEIGGLEKSMAIPGVADWSIGLLAAHLENQGFTVTIHAGSHAGVFRAVRN